MLKEFKYIAFSPDSEKKIAEREGFVSPVENDTKIGQR